MNDENKNHNEEPGWMRGLLNKFPLEAVAILLELVSYALRWGQVSAADIKTRLPKDKCKLAGAVFKLLPRFGIHKSRSYVQHKDNRRHGAEVPIWVLEERGIAESLLPFLQLHVLGKKAEMECKREPTLFIHASQEEARTASKNMTQQLQAQA